MDKEYLLEHLDTLDLPESEPPGIRPRNDSLDKGTHS